MSAIILPVLCRAQLLPNDGHGYQAQALWALAEGSLDACAQRCDLTHTVGITFNAHEHRDPRVGVIIVDTAVWVDSLRGTRNPETEWLGRQADQLDCFIATFCLANTHALFDRDHHFDAFETNLGLAVLHPS